MKFVLNIKVISTIVNLIDNKLLHSSKVEYAYKSKFN